MYDCSGFWSVYGGWPSAVVAKDLVLGLIIDRPDYGYSLRRRFEDLFGDMGFAESIVYSALDSLEKDGLIEPVGERKSGGGWQAERTEFGLWRDRGWRRVLR